MVVLTLDSPEDIVAGDGAIYTCHSSLSDTISAVDWLWDGMLLDQNSSTYPAGVLPHFISATGQSRLLIKETPPAYSGAAIQCVITFLENGIPCNSSAADTLIVIGKFFCCDKLYAII